MQCGKCGHENNDHAKFCSKCGTQQQLNCSGCGAEYEKGTKFCKKCGMKLMLEDTAAAIPVVEGKVTGKSNRYLVMIAVVLVGVLVIGASVLIGSILKKNSKTDSAWELNAEEDIADGYSTEQVLNEATTETTTEPITELTTEANTELLPETTAASFILPNSSISYISTADLVFLSSSQLRLARNEIYARYGRRFKDESLQRYFDNQAWYTGTIEPDDFNESILNRYEKANLILIKDIEGKKDEM